MKRLWLLFAQVVTVLLALYFVVATLQPSWLQRNNAVRSNAGVRARRIKAGAGDPAGWWTAVFASTTPTSWSR